jgi:hypothetical protein
MDNSVLEAILYRLAFPFYKFLLLLDYNYSGAKKKNKKINIKVLIND